MPKSREEAARFVEKQFKSNYKCTLTKGSVWHYGKQEVRELMDYIYESKPTNTFQLIK